ncbi:MAG: hypothetical protein RSB03_07695, partial [Oscillospiraceae bacterium]
MNALQKKSIDYLKVYNRKPEMSSKNRGLILMALPVAAMSVLCGVTAVGMGGKLRSVKAQCDAQRSYLADSAVNEKYSTYDAVLADYSAAVALNTELTDAKSAVSLFPKINSTLINAVKSVTGEGVVIETYS